MLNVSTPSEALVKYLNGGAAGYRWVLATVGANDAAGYQLATGDAVMAIGGFNGSDPAPTLAEFEKLVAAGKIHYFIGGGVGGGPAGAGGSSAASDITTWVESHFSATTVGGDKRLRPRPPGRLGLRYTTSPARWRVDSWGRARSAALELL